ncbi:MAG: glutathione S-transferase family protein [Myxococcota bacterium]|jgi:glutathione S-transferase|nr:glutathione S-transferase family protein [Myxococcota bacterium]
MKLYDFHYAPNPRKVRVYLAEKGLSIPLVPVNLMQGEQNAPAFLAKNPMGGLPVLELDDGTCLRESLAIIEYLEELHPAPPMIGTTPLERAQVRAIERTADLGLVGGVARVFHNTLSVLPGREPNPEMAAIARRDLERPSRHLASLLGDGRAFLAGDRVTIADCTAFAAIEFARTGNLAIAWPDALAAWFDRFRERPSAAA